MAPMPLRRTLLVFIALCFVAASCSGTDGAATTTTGAGGAPATTQQPTTPPPAPDPAYDELIGLDADIRTGVLDNGLTYFVRRNTAPGGRLQLRLVIDAGSVLEDDDQGGAAHFLEHMMFNGTQRWPENELVAVLESFGAQFGPDINAYTGYDETVYQLEVGSDSESVALAFDVLREWAANATIDQADVVDERGVVIEEWRLRDQGISGRIGALFEQLLLAGTGYEARPPIGTLAALEQTNAAELRRFYEDWYRPDLMAIIAVGDLPVDRLEDEIVDRFSDLTGPVATRERVQPLVPVSSAPRIVTFADPELPSAFAEFLYPGPVVVPGSYGALRDVMASQVAWDIVAERLDRDIVAGTASYFAIGAVEIPFARELSVPGLEVDANAEDLGSAILAIAREVERVRRYGFTEAEFARAVERRRAQVDQTLAAQGTRQDIEFAEALVDTFLAGVPLPAARDAHELDIRALDELTVERVEERFLSVVTAAPAVLAIGPDEFAGALPTEDQIAQLLDFVVTAEIEPRPDEESTATMLMDRPTPASVVDRRDDIFDVVWLEFANGVVVGLIETPIAENTVVLGAASGGGYSVADADAVTEAVSIADIVSLSGVGDFDRIALEQLLAGEVVRLAPYLSPVQEGLTGEAATEDLETLLQLVHLFMTEPRADGSAVESYISQVRPFFSAPLEVPGLASDVTLANARYGVDNLWYTFPRVEELDTFDVDLALDFYRDRFGDASDFVFVLSGDFDSAEVEPLVAAYLGTLPGSGREDAFVDRQPDPPDGVISETVAVGSDPQGNVSILLTGVLEASNDERIHARLLELIATTRLRDRLREALSATYSPQILVDTYDAPDEIIETYIQVSGDPERLAEISAETLGVLNDLATDGPTATELASAQEQLSTEYELVSNEFWVDTLIFYALNPDESLVDVAGRIEAVFATTTSDIRVLAATAWPPNEYIEVRQVPAP